jgi:hypothetical protein
MSGVQIDLVLGAVQSEPDGPASVTAIEVIDEHGLDFLGHSVSVLVADLHASVGIPGGLSVLPHRCALRLQGEWTAALVRARYRDGSWSASC